MVWGETEVGSTFVITLIVGGCGFVELSPVAGNGDNSLSEVKVEFTYSILESISQCVLEVFSLGLSEVSEVFVELHLILNDGFDFAGVNGDSDSLEFISSNSSSYEGEDDGFHYSLIKDTNY